MFKRVVFIIYKKRVETSDPYSKLEINKSKIDLNLFSTKLKKNEIRLKFEVVKERIKLFYRKYKTVNPKKGPIRRKRNKLKRSLIIHLIQNSFKSLRVLVFNSKFKIVQSGIMERSLNEHISFGYLQLLCSKYGHFLHILIYTNIKHFNFFKKFSVILKQFTSLKILENSSISLFMFKPNFFFINLQYRKIKAIKKSRKKVLYINIKQKNKKKMLNTYIFILIICNITVVTLIFWVITLLEIYFNKNTQHETKSTVYECGFLTVNKNIFPVTTNLIILLMFSVIYEVEFILVTPLLLSINVLTPTQILNICIIFIFIIVTLYIDIWLKKINWVYKC